MGNQIVDEGKLLLIDIHPAYKWRTIEITTFEVPNELMDAGSNHQWLLMLQKEAITYMYAWKNTISITYKNVLQKKRNQAWIWSSL